MRRALLLTAAPLLSNLVSAQLNQGTPGTSAGNSIFNGSRLCDRTFADANSTGVFSYDPQITTQSDSDNILSDPINWAVTVHQSPNTTAPDALTELSLWFSPNGADYSDNFRLGYDVCYLWLSAMTLNTYERGHSDNGSCLQTFDPDCVSDMQRLTNQFTTELVGEPSPGPNSNLSTNSLPTVCQDLAKMLTDSFPDSCEVYFNDTRRVSGGPPYLGGALTGNQSIVDDAHCTMNDTYSIMYSQYGPATLENYYVANYFVVPLITAFMPIADANRPENLGYSKSLMSCVRLTNLNPGSAAIPAAPAPTAVSKQNGSSGGGLSLGAVTGIVVGVVLALLVAAAMALGFCFRKKIKDRAAKRGSWIRMTGAIELDGEEPQEKRVLPAKVLPAKTPPAKTLPARVERRSAWEMGDMWEMGDSAWKKAELGHHKQQPG